MAILVVGLSNAKDSKNKKTKKTKQLQFSPKKQELQKEAEGEGESTATTENPLSKLTTIKPDFENIGDETIKNLNESLTEIFKYCNKTSLRGNATFADYTDALLLITEDAIANDTKVSKLKTKIKQEIFILNSTDSTKKELDAAKEDKIRLEGDLEKIEPFLKPIRTKLIEIGITDSTIGNLSEIKEQLPHQRFTAMIYHSASKNLQYLKKYYDLRNKKNQTDADEDQMEILKNEKISQAMKWYNVYINYQNNTQLLEDLKKSKAAENMTLEKFKKLDQKFDPLMGKRIEYLKIMMALGFEYTLEDKQEAESKIIASKDAEIDRLNQTVISKEGDIEFFRREFANSSAVLELDKKELEKQKSNFSKIYDDAIERQKKVQQDLKDEKGDKAKLEKENVELNKTINDMAAKMKEKDEQIKAKDDEIKLKDDDSGSTNSDANFYLMLHFAFVLVFFI